MRVGTKQNKAEKGTSPPNNFHKAKPCCYKFDQIKNTVFQLIDRWSSMFHSFFPWWNQQGFVLWGHVLVNAKKNNANSGVWRVNAQNMVNTCKYMLHVDTYRYQRFWQVSTQKPQTSLNYIRHRHFVKPINLWHLAIWHPTCLGLAPTVGLPALKTAANCEGIKAMPLGSLWHGESMYCAAWALGQQQCLWIFTRLRPAKSF